MAGRPERLITYEDYATFPDEPRLEVIGGEAYVVPSPDRRHQKLILRLGKWIDDCLELNGGGEVFVARSTWCSPTSTSSSPTSSSSPTRIRRS